MVPGACQWDRMKMNDLLNSQDIEKILAIPLSITQLEDTWMWRLAHKGQFSVRSAYKVLLPEIVDRLDLCSWSGLYNVRVPYKVHHVV